MPVQFAMVDAAYRNGELVADLAAQCTRLGEAQMVGIGGRATAYHARLGGYEFAMIFVAQANSLGGDLAAADTRLS